MKQKKKNRDFKKKNLFFYNLYKMHDKNSKKKKEFN